MLRFSLIPRNLVIFLLRLWLLRHLWLLTVVLLLQMVLLLGTSMIIVHSGRLAVFTATAVAAVTIGPVLYSVVVLVPAPAPAILE